MPTYQPSKQQALSSREWVVVDAGGRTLGRLASEVARILRGKHKVTYTPHLDTGDFVIVINARSVRLSGKKLAKKLYYRHSEYPGGIRTRTAGEMLATRPEQLIRLAVRGMLPRNRLGRKLLTKLKIYADADHPHQAQQPKQVAVRD